MSSGIEHRGGPALGKIRHAPVYHPPPPPPPPPPPDDPPEELPDEDEEKPEDELLGGGGRLDAIEVESELEKSDIRLPNCLWSKSRPAYQPGL